MYRGWIILPADIGGKIIIECEIFLRNKKEDGSYDCEVSNIGMEKLDKYWGEAYWGLEYEEI